MNTWKPQYLHQVSDRVSWLDHRLVPEVRAMVAAMMSRVPRGGIKARYMEVLTAIAAEQYTPDSVESAIANLNEEIVYSDAEIELTSYPLHSRVQKFFDKFVGQYGHSSVKELTGSPCVIAEGISWWAAYLSFDNPLVRGQEMSTRAVWRRDWPMAQDAPQGLEEMHKLGLEIAWHETEAWKQERLQKCSDCGGSKVEWYSEGGTHYKCCGITEVAPGVIRYEGHGPWDLGSSFIVDGSHLGSPDQITLGTACPECRGTGQKHSDFDPQGAFRFAFDHARWALPGTISTGVSHCGDIRTMGRVISQMEALATNQGARDLVEEIKTGYRQALPGLAGMWNKESSHTQAALEYHLSDTLTEFEWEPAKVEVSTLVNEGNTTLAPKQRTNRRSYVDSTYNQIARINFSIPCSLAASRDWHRHRSAMPWKLKVLLAGHPDMKILGLGLPDGASIQIDPRYTPISEFGKQNVDRYLSMCSKSFLEHIDTGDRWGAMLCLPLGTRVRMSAQSGLKDFVYMTELRGYTHGANFEYQEQARELLIQLKELLPPKLAYHLGLNLEF